MEKPGKPGMEGWTPVVGVRDGDALALYGHFGWFCTVVSQSVPYGCHGQFRTVVAVSSVQSGLFQARF